jgi:hypothetical protein
VQQPALSHSAQQMRKQTEAAQKAISKYSSSFLQMFSDLIQDEAGPELRRDYNSPLPFC